MIGYDAFRAEQAAARAEGRLLGIGLGLYVEPSGIAHRQHGERGRHRPRRRQRSGAGADGQRQPRSEPRDDDRPGRRRPPRRRRRRRHRRPGRHRVGAVRAGHRRQPQRGDPCSGAAPSGGRSRCAAKVARDRRPRAWRPRPTTSRSSGGPGLRGRHARRGDVHRRGRPHRLPRPGRACRRAWSWGSRRRPATRRGAVHVVELVPRLHLRGRPAHRRGDAPALRRQRGLRRDDQPDGRRGPDRRRRRAGHRRRAVRAHGLRRRRQPAQHDVPRLPAADGGRGADSSSTATSRRRRPTNPGGYKGMGEGGAIGSPPAVINAVADALAPLGAKVNRQPLGPADIVAAIAAAGVRSR